MKDLNEFKNWLEKEIEDLKEQFELTDGENQPKLLTLNGRLRELDRIKEILK